MNAKEILNELVCAMEARTGKRSHLAHSSVDQALRVGVRYGDFDVAVAAVGAGAQCFNSALRIAASLRDFEMADRFVSFFISNGANSWSDGLRRAASVNNQELIRRFIDLGATDFTGAIAGASMYRGGEEAAMAMVERFLDLGGVVSIDAIEFAADNGYVSLVQTMLRDDLEGEKFDEALFSAAGSKNGEAAALELCDLFVKLGAVPNEYTLDAAIEAGYVQVVTLLLERGPEVSLELVSMARQLGHAELAELLSNRISTDAPQH